MMRMVCGISRFEYWAIESANYAQMAVSKWTFESHGAFKTSTVGSTELTGVYDNNSFCTTYHDVAVPIAWMDGRTGALSSDAVE